MQSIRDSLPEALWKGIERGLGREQALRLLWPAVVGARLASNTQLKSLRGATLVVSVPDRVWKSSLESLEKMILEAVNRFWNEPICHAIEFLVDPRGGALIAQRAGAQRRSPSRELPPVDLPVGQIGDEGLRAAFLRSAEKYFAWQEERRK